MVTESPALAPVSTTPLVGTTVSHGTSLNAGTPLSMRYAMFGAWAIAQRLPAGSISRPAPR